MRTYILLNTDQNLGVRSQKYLNKNPREWLILLQSHNWNKTKKKKKREREKRNKERGLECAAVDALEHTEDQGSHAAGRCWRGCWFPWPHPGQGAADERSQKSLGGWRKHLLRGTPWPWLGHGGAQRSGEQVPQLRDLKRAAKPSSNFRIVPWSTNDRSLCVRACACVRACVRVCLSFFWLSTWNSSGTKHEFTIKASRLVVNSSHREEEGTFEWNFFSFFL